MSHRHSPARACYPPHRAFLFASQGQQGRACALHLGGLQAQLRAVRGCAAPPDSPDGVCHEHEPVRLLERLRGVRGGGLLFFMIG